MKINEFSVFLFHRAYSQVNWDSKLPKKLHAPTSTFEKLVDPLKQSDQTDHRTQIWQVQLLFF